MKFISLLFLLVTGAATAAPVTADQAYLLNQMNPLFRKYSIGAAILQAYNTATAVYDFSVLGGAVGTVNLLDVYQPRTGSGSGGASATGKALKTVTLPKNAIIRNVFLDVITQPTSGGSATVAFTSVGAGDLKTATAIASLTVGEIAGAVAFATPSGYIKTAANTVLKATIGTAALTAGKIAVVIDYVVTQ